MGDAVSLRKVSVVSAGPGAKRCLYSPNIRQYEKVRGVLNGYAAQAKRDSGGFGGRSETDTGEAADVAAWPKTLSGADHGIVRRTCAQCEQEEQFQRQPVEEEEALQAGRASHDMASIPMDVERQIRRVRQGGAPLPGSQRVFFESRFGTRFDGVRIHADAAAAESAASIGARAYTLDNHLVFGRGEFRPGTESGDRLIAHELTHVLQQSNASAGDTLQRQPGSQISDRDRFRTVHQNLFVDAPGTGTATRHPWQAGTAAQIIQQFKTALQQKIDRRPLSVLGNIPDRTSEADADTTAIQVDRRIRATYPQIGTALSEQQIRSSVSLLGSSQISNANFISQWLTNRLFKLTNIGNFTVDETDTHFQEVVQILTRDRAPFDFTNALNTLTATLSGRSGWTSRDVAIVVQRERRRVASFTWSDVIRVLASRTGAFVETSQSGRKIFLSAGLSASARTLTLIHELIHFYAHDRFKEWVATTTASRFYGEGFTEYLARQVMTPQEARHRTSYQSRFDAIEQEVAPYVSLDDIGRAYFAGEVWRLETQSAVAQRLFGDQVGLHAGGDRNTEVMESATSQGIVQTVTTGSHYRFMNLAVNSDRPKSEHEIALRQILADHVRNNPAARIRFVGHTSSTGSASHNLRLGRRRARAFYELAWRLGVPEAQLIDASNPATRGETQRNVAERDQVIHRALNRRVEMFIE